MFGCIFLFSVLFMQILKVIISNIHFVVVFLRLKEPVIAPQNMQSAFFEVR